MKPERLMAHYTEAARLRAAAQGGKCCWNRTRCPFVQKEQRVRDSGAFPESYPIGRVRAIYALMIRSPVSISAR